MSMEEAENILSSAVDNAVHDISNGDSISKAVDAAFDEIGIEQDAFGESAMDEIAPIITSEAEMAQKENDDDNFEYNEKHGKMIEKAMNFDIERMTSKNNIPKDVATMLENSYFEFVGSTIDKDDVYAGKGYRISDKNRHYTFYAIDLPFEKRVLMVGPSLSGNHKNVTYFNEFGDDFPTSFNDIKRFFYTLDVDNAESLGIVTFTANDSPTVGENIGTKNTNSAVTESEYDQKVGPLSDAARNANDDGGTDDFKPEYLDAFNEILSGAGISKQNAEFEQESSEQPFVNIRFNFRPTAKEIESLAAGAGKYGWLVRTDPMDGDYVQLQDRAPSEKEQTAGVGHLTDSTRRSSEDEDRVEFKEEYLDAFNDIVNDAGMLRQNVSFRQDYLNKPFVDIYFKGRLTDKEVKGLVAGAKKYGWRVAIDPMRGDQFAQLQDRAPSEEEQGV
jgi:hypothetical protein